MLTLDDAILKRQAGRRILEHRLRSGFPIYSVALGSCCTWNERPPAVSCTSAAMNCAYTGRLVRTIRDTCRARYNQRPAILRRAL